MTLSLLVVATLLWPVPARAATLAYGIVDANTIAIIDPTTASVIARVPVGFTPVDIAVDPSGQLAYVAVFHSDAVAVVDVASGTVIARLPVPRPTRIFMESTGARLFVSSERLHPGEAPEGLLTLIDTGQQRVEGELSLGQGVFAPGAFARDTPRQRGYFLQSRDFLQRDPPQVMLVDELNTIRTLATLPIDPTPPSVIAGLVALHPSGDVLYATTFPLAGTRQLATVDARTGAVVSTVPVDGFGPVAVAPRGAGALVYAATSDGTDIRVLDAASGAELATVLVGSPASTVGAITVHPRSGLVYALLIERSTCVSVRVPCPPLHMTGIAVIDPTTFTVRATVSAGAGDFAGTLLVPPSGDRLYVVGPGTFSILDADQVVFSAPLFVRARAIGPDASPGIPGRLTFHGLSSRTGAARAEAWGAPGDRPVPADYDGDGRVDAAVWRPREGGEEGFWFVRRSADGGAERTQFGAAQLGDQPVPADYDGDGRADVGVYRPLEGAEQGIWYVVSSGTRSTIRRPWGTAGDLPVPADYDGDRRADVAVWRPNIGTWFVVNSRDGSVTARQWGAFTDVPVPADYNGDGKADVAVWRPATGEWFVIGSSTGAVTSVAFGAPGDVPVPADYDGDGKADVAVWRPATGEWFVRSSRDGSVVARGWGAIGDVPVPRDYDGDGQADLTVYRP